MPRLVPGWPIALILQHFTNKATELIDFACRGTKSVCHTPRTEEHRPMNVSIFSYKCMVAPVLSSAQTVRVRRVHRAPDRQAVGRLKCSAFDHALASSPLILGRKSCLHLFSLAQNFMKSFVVLVQSKARVCMFNRLTTFQGNHGRGGSPMRLDVGLIEAQRRPTVANRFTKFPASVHRRAVAEDYCLPNFCL